jgi:Ca-activated chloride channel family protein
METLSDFHFLRPFWLLLILPCFWLCYRIWKTKQSNTGLETHIDKSLLPYLRLGKTQPFSLLPFVMLATASLLVCIALAGPTWKKRPQPVFESQSAVVVILDLSPSMRAEDIKPSRIVRAHLKIQDLLSQRKEGITALVVYAGEAHVVTPMTDDAKTISNLLPTLKPGILPVPGSNVEMALSLSADLVQASGLPRASFLLITDDLHPNAVTTITKNLPPYIDLTIIGVGTETGAPIPFEGDFLKDSSGSIVVSKRSDELLQTLASKTGGYYLPIQNDTSDIEFFLKHLDQKYSTADKKESGKQNHDAWYEFGPTIILLMLPILALFFRKGWLVPCVATCVFLSALSPQYAYASLWDSIWKNSDQRGLNALEEQDYSKAAKEFNNPQWQGTAQYKNGEYEAALKNFETDKSAEGYYNKGNALAQLQRFDEAIAAYTTALEKKPDFPEAKKNKTIVEQAKQQAQQNQQENNSKEGENNESSDQNQNSEGNNNQQTGNEQDQSNSDPSSAQNQQNNRENSSKEESNSQQTASNESEGEHPKSQNTDKDSLAKEETEKQSNISDDSLSLTENLSDEEQQALQQWLRKVPDDPSGLLKRKFEYEFQKRRKQYQQGEWKLPENNAHKRY